MFFHRHPPTLGIALIVCKLLPRRPQHDQTMGNPVAKLRSGDRGRRMREKLFKRQNGRCFWCRIKMTRSGNMIPLLTDVTVDHIKPRYLGGSNGFWNLVAACYECNQYRGLLEDLFNNQSKRPGVGE